MSSQAPTAATLLLFIFLSVNVSLGEYTSQSLSLRLDTLLAEYDRELAPSDSAVQVAVSLDVRHAAVDDRRAIMRLLADLKMSWNDQRLVWNASEWETESALVWAERLWKPDVALLSAGSSGGAGDAALRAGLDSHGGVSLVTRLDISVPLSLNLVRWPRDEQQAVFKFASTAHGEDEITLVMDEYKSVLVVECGAWEVVSVTGSVESHARADGGAVSTAAWSVRLARRGAAQAAAAGAVFTAAVLVLLAAVALPFPQRAPFAACAAFLAATWLLTAIFHIPGAASSPRAMSVMCAVCVAGAACGAAAAAAARLARRTSAPPAALRALLSRVSAVYAITPDPQEEAAGKSGAWTAAARLLDAVAVSALVLAVLVLVAVYLLA